MARKKRFRALKAALGYLKASGTDGSGEAVAAPANTQLKKFQDYLGGSVDVTYGARAANSLTKGLGSKLIKLFGGAGKKGSAKLSNRAIDKIADAKMDAATLNWLAEGASDYSGEFIPAKAHIIIVPANAASSTPVSKLTGRKYKSKKAAGYTYPFGEKATAAGYKAICDAIVAKLKDAPTEGERRSVSFNPEDLL